MSEETHLFTVGGTIDPESGIYLIRKADQELLQCCREGIFAYVLAPRQVGKSSLIVQTAQHLENEGIRTTSITLEQLGTQLDAEQWYQSLIITIADQLMLTTDVIKWWASKANLGFATRLTLFFRDIVLSEVGTSLVIFVDEIDTTLSLSFTDDFFGVIRSLYSMRPQFKQLKRLSFVLIGVATPAELIADPNRTPFNIGHGVDMTDFSFSEALPLAKGFGRSETENKKLLEWVFKWTAGHPYLTQRLSQAIAEQENKVRSEAAVTDLVYQLFLRERSFADNNLQFVRNMVLRRSEDPVAMLVTYQEIWHNKKVVLNEERSYVKTQLKLSGLVKQQSNRLVVRNKIYYKVFDEKWIKTNLPVNWARRLEQAFKLVVTAVIVAILMSILAIYAFVEQGEANKMAITAVAGRQQAEQQKQIAYANLGRSLAAQSRNYYATGRLDLGLLLSQEAIRLSNTSETRGSLLDGLNYDPAVSGYLSGHTNSVESLAFSPSDPLLASASADKTIHLWDINSRQTLKILRGHTDLVLSVAFSPDGKFLASGSVDRTVRLWDVSSGQPVGQPFTGFTGYIKSVAFSPDGKLLAMADQDSNNITIKELLTGQNRQIIPADYNKEVGISSLAFSPDHSLLAAGGNGPNIWLWQPSTGQLLGRLPVANVTSLAFSPDGNLLAAASANSSVYVWNVKTLTPFGQPLRLHKARVNVVAFSPNGKILLSGGEDNLLIRWELTNNQFSGKPSIIHSSAVRSAAFSPDGGWLASGAFDGTIILSKVEPDPVFGQVLESASAQISKLKYSPDGLKIIATTDDISVHVWESSDFQTVKAIFRGQGIAFSSALSPDGKLAAFGTSDGKIFLWNLENGQLVGQPLTGHTATVTSLSFSPDGKLLASGSEDKAICIWDIAKGKLYVPPLAGHTDLVFEVAFSSDGNWLASGSQDKTVRLWDLTKPVVLSRVIGAHLTTVRSLSFSPDSHLLASGDASGIILLWDVNSGGKQSGQLLSAHHSVVRTIAFSSDGKLLASGNDDKSIQLWDVARAQPIGQPLLGHSEAVRALVFSPDGNWLASGGDDKKIILQPVSLALWETQACRIVNRNLSLSEWQLYLQDIPYHKTCPA